MTFWQFLAAVDGYMKAHATDDGKLSSSEIDDLWEWMKMKEGS